MTAHSYFPLQTPFPFSRLGMCDLKPSLASCWNSLAVFEEHKDIFLSWLSAASLITQPSLETAGKETNNKPPRFGVALWLHIKLCWFYKLLKIGCLKKVSTEDSLPSSPSPIPHHRESKTFMENAWQKPQNSCHPKTKTEPAQENVQVMVLFSAVKLRGNPFLLNSLARCYLWFLSWEFHFTSMRNCHVFSHRFQKNMGFLKKAFTKSTKSAKEGKLISHLLFCCASKAVLSRPCHWLQEHFNKIIKGRAMAGSAIWSI